ncbi:MAG: cation transporter [Ignavibacteriae bacterium HGW-Ignavibacteriae-2]|nr:MAG: cation transporter [Ignavibacteriae bacterium HGW-Ignavibacteriae-2]
MSHDHKHNHITSTTGRLFLTMVLNFTITAAEIIGGILSGSLSLISDALHNFSDGISVILSYIAIKLKSRKNSYNHTFGLKRAEILAAALNSSTLIVISIYLFYEAVQRFFNPQIIEAQLMIIVASIGLAANIAGTLLLHRDSKNSINIKASYLHLLSDAVSSVAVILGGLAIYLLNVYWIDPLLTILIGIYIVWESFKILSDATHILMEGTPENISVKEIKKLVSEIRGVVDIHHIHVWSVGENDIHLEAHVNINDMMISESVDIRLLIENTLNEKFGINHVTLQLECNNCKDTSLIHQH